MLLLIWHAHQMWISQYITPDEVAKAFAKLKPKQPAGPNKIPFYILKRCVDIFSHPLCLIFNLSL